MFRVLLHVAERPGPDRTETLGYGPFGEASREGKRSLSYEKPLAAGDARFVPRSRERGSCPSPEGLDRRRSANR